MLKMSSDAPLIGAEAGSRLSELRDRLDHQIAADPLGIGAEQVGAGGGKTRIDRQISARRQHRDRAVRDALCVHIDGAREVRVALDHQQVARTFGMIGVHDEVAPRALIQIADDRGRRDAVSSADGERTLIVQLAAGAEVDLRSRHDPSGVFDRCRPTAISEVHAADDASRIVDRRVALSAIDRRSDVTPDRGDHAGIVDDVCCSQRGAAADQIDARAIAVADAEVRASGNEAALMDRYRDERCALTGAFRENGR
ncbi:MAG TPA: hypothetical protein VNX29_19995 [Kaistia sp.]|nr:hypothetical protein [Kaistia sp.]